jgi:lysophospholipase L1-like esterase
MIKKLLTIFGFCLAINSFAQPGFTPIITGGGAAAGTITNLSGANGITITPGDPVIVDGSTLNNAISAETSARAAADLVVSNAAVTLFTNPIINPTGRQLRNGQTIQFYGDSLTSGTGGTPYPTQLASMLGITVNNLSVGGVSAASIFTNQFLPNSNNWTMPSVFWMGNNDGACDTNLTYPYITNIIARLRSVNNSNYLFFSLVTGTNTIGAWLPCYTNHNIMMTNVVGARNFLNIWEVLLRSTNGSAADALNVSNGWTPASLLVDSVHLNTLGYGIVATNVANSPLMDWDRPSTRGSVIAEIKSATNGITSGTSSAAITDVRYSAWPPIGASGSPPNSFVDLTTLDSADFTAAGIWGYKQTNGTFQGVFCVAPIPASFTTNILTLGIATTNSFSPDFYIYYAYYTNGMVGAANTLGGPLTFTGGQAGKTNLLFRSLTNVVSATQAGTATYFPRTTASWNPNTNNIWYIGLESRWLK